jgi:phosphatidate cytidylyltransferase
MHFFNVARTACFWWYTGAAALFLLAAYGGLTWQRLRGRRLEEWWRAFWSWVAVLGIITFGTLLGREVFALTVACVSLFACKEFARATGLYDDWIFTGCVYVAIVSVNLIAVWAGYDIFMAAPIYVVAGLCILPILRDRTAGMLQCVALSVMAFVYFGYFLAHLSLLDATMEQAAIEKERPDAYGYIFFVLYGVVTTDLAGWLAGRQLGRHPIAPKITADVTLESFVVSLAWAALWSFTVGWTLPAPWTALIWSTLLLGIMAPAGDLVMRYILRDLGLKAPAEGTTFVPFLALAYLYRLIFVAPLFLRLVHWFEWDLFQRLGAVPVSLE